MSLTACFQLFISEHVWKRDLSLPMCVRTANFCMEIGDLSQQILGFLVVGLCRLMIHDSLTRYAFTVRCRGSGARRGSRIWFREGVISSFCVILSKHFLL